MKILVVEDGEVVRKLLAEVLQGQGHEVTCAEDGVEALHILERGSCYDLVLSDVDMPRMGGVELMSRLPQGQPFVLMTADSSAARQQELRSAGYRGVILLKPWRLNALFAAVAEAIRA